MQIKQYEVYNMATTPVTNAVNNTAQQKAAQQTAAATSKPSTAIVQQSALSSNIKNALFGAGSLESSDVHLGSVQSDIANALKASPNNANLLAAQKALAVVNSSATPAQKTAAYSAAQKSLQSLISGSSGKSSTPVTTPKTTTPATSAVSSSTVSLYNSTVISNVKNALNGAGSLTSGKPNVSSILTDVNNALKVSPKDADLLSAQKSLTTALSSSTSATAKAASLATAQKSLQTILGSSAAKTITPTTPVTPTPNQPATSTVVYDVRNALNGAESLTSKSPNVSLILKDVNDALKISPKDTDLLNAQKNLTSITSKSTAAQKTAALAATQKSLQSLYDASKKGTTPTPTPTPIIPAPTPTPTPTPTPVDSISSIESNIRNSLFGKGSFETTALDFNTVNKNISAALGVAAKSAPFSTVGNTTPTDYQKVQTSLLSAQKNMSDALGNKGTDDTAAKQRATAFTAAKSDLTNAEKLMNGLGYKGSGGVL
jgi:hypothetical protein